MAILRWQQNGGNYRPTSPNTVPKLPNHVMTLDMSMMGPELNTQSESFELPSKMYDLVPGFVERVVKTHDARGKSTGVLLRGLKGGGKTIMAKQLCIAAKRPVIIVAQNHPVFVDFLAQINQSCVIFLDEFEKIFNDEEGEQNGFLSLMDGVIGSAPHIYLLTVNEPRVNTNMFDRPGRIRYNVEYKDLPQQIVEMVVDDLLINTDWRDQIISYLSQRAVLSIDSVKSVVEEVNIHDHFDADQFDKWFNLSKNATSEYSLYDGESWVGTLSSSRKFAWLPENNKMNYTNAGTFGNHRFVQIAFDPDKKVHTIALLRPLTSREQSRWNEYVGENDDEENDNEVYDEHSGEYITLNASASEFNRMFNPSVTDERLKTLLAAHNFVLTKIIDLTTEAVPAYHMSYYDAL